MEGRGDRLHGEHSPCERSRRTTGAGVKRTLTWIEMNVARLAGA